MQAQQQGSKAGPDHNAVSTTPVKAEAADTGGQHGPIEKLPSPFDKLASKPATGVKDERSGNNSAAAVPLGKTKGGKPRAMSMQEMRAHR